MECDDGSNFSGNGLHMAGAIFMCNQTTKKECFRRKLFGLPSSQAEFVKNVKSGMFLFLFEYEERKLYGVFEAVCDGAMNSVPHAFSESGNKFPAQVHFNNLWVCHPLSEYEFRSAIQENYYTHKKFNFGLSYEQVSRLLELFSSKKLSPQIHQDIGVHSKEKNRSGNNNVTGRAKSIMFDGTESCRETDMRMKSSFDVNYSTYNQNPGPTAGHRNVGTEHQSYPRVPSGLQPHLPNMMRLTPQTGYCPEASYSVNTEGRPFYPIIPGSEGEQQYDVLGIGKPNSSRNFTEAQAPHFRSDFYPSETLTLPYTDYCKPNSFTELEISPPNLPHRLTEVQNPLFRSPSYPSHDPRTYSLHSPSNRGFISLSNHDDSYLQKEDPVNFPNYVSRDSLVSKFCATDATGSLGPLHGQVNTLGYTEASQNIDNVRGSRYWNSVPSNVDSRLPLTENENLIGNSEAPFVSSRYSKEYHYVNEYDPTRDDYCLQCNPVPADHEVQSDSLQKRTSVFSRLKAPKGFGLGEKICQTKRNSALDLLRHLAQRTKQWNKIGKVSKRSLAGSKDDGSKRLDNADQIEPTADSIAGLESDSETFAKENVETPLLNFKRRSKSRNMESENERNISTEGGEGKCKRRKLIRPSFTEDGSSAPIKPVSQEFQTSRQEFTAINSAVTDAQTNEDEGTRALAAGPINGGHMNSKVFVEDSGGSGKQCAEFGEVLAKLLTFVDEERILSSNSMAAANAAKAVECGIEYSKESDEKFHAVEDQGGATNETGENSKISVSDREHAVVESDNRCKGRNSPVLQEEDAALSGINSKDTYLSNANFPNPDSATMEAGPKFKSDLIHGRINSSQLSKKTRVTSAGNVGKVSLRKENIRKKLEL